MKSRIVSQNGHASILFVMIIPVLFGVFMLGTDGARALQQKARLQDASEVAVLAVTAHADQNIVGEGQAPEGGSKVNRAIVADFISAYFPDVKINGPEDLTNLRIERKECSQLADCSADGYQFFQYQIQAAFKYDTWFPGNSAIVGFGDQVEVGGLSTARKYQNNAVDLMLVADYSGSMTLEWDGGNKKKYQDLFDIIKEVALELDDYNKQKVPGQTSTIGITPYNHFVFRKKGAGGVCNNVTNGDVWNVEHTKFTNNATDFQATILAAETPIDSDVCPSSNEYKESTFYSIGLTTNISNFISSINRFQPSSYTASFQGIIEGYKHLKEGKNKKKLLVILSDGVDTEDHAPKGKIEPGSPSNRYPSYKKIGSTLVDKPHLLCEKVRNGLSKNGENVQLYLIGFDYRPGATNKALDECVGAGNILYANNKEEIKKTLLSLMAEEIGHLK
ncbi:pilus assembly protein [Vibrio scophthalmi]|uniref:TadE/TadG family type IV pilus assembly protein n=1 Tax=Vibrio scophthalmi TaxID=45658 RepID=UPI002283397A|nr:TadE/TadG family type IV pilus assembly protein [Vibrio scophthalmi]MCY9803675.1 pilus assembly protein [Vibrio scophthalmi]